MIKIIIKPLKALQKNLKLHKGQCKSQSKNQEPLSFRDFKEGKKQRGQFLIEYLLLAVLMISVYALIKKRFEGENFIARIFSGPWPPLHR